MDPIRNRTVRLLATPHFTNGSEPARSSLRGLASSTAPQRFRSRSVLDRLAEGVEIQIEPPDPKLLKELVLGIGIHRSEHMALINLDHNGCVICADIICEGSSDRLEGQYRSIVSSALNHAAHSIIVAHNHPSGSLKPSDADRFFTSKLAALLLSVEVLLSDHIIVTRNEAFSMRMAGYL